MKFHFVQQYRETFTVGQLCQVLEVSRGGFYSWLRRPHSNRERENTQLVERIRAVHRQHRGVYGSPRIYQVLRTAGHTVGKHRVARLMRQERIRASAAKRRFPYISTDRLDDVATAPNRLLRNFRAEAPNRVWVADITQVRTREGWLFLATILDVFSRRIVGWATSDRPEQKLALEALRSAIASRRPSSGLLHHSDRGGQYGCANYQELLDRHGMIF